MPHPSKYGSQHKPALPDWCRVKAGVGAACVGTVVAAAIRVALPGLRLFGLGERGKGGGSTSNKLRGLKGEPLPKRRLFWALQGGRAAAVREGPWKLVVAGKGPAKLCNLKEDLKEANDRAADHPQLARKFGAALEAWQAEVRASATVQPPAPTGAK